MLQPAAGAKGTVASLASFPAAPAAPAATPLLIGGDETTVHTSTRTHALETEGGKGRVGSARNETGGVAAVR